MRRSNLLYWGVRVTFFTILFLFAMQNTGCIDITGSYAKELKALHAQKSKLKSIIITLQSKLDKKEQLDQEVSEYKRKIVEFNCYMITGDL